MTRARRRTRATTSRIRRLSSSLYLARPPLPPSWSPVPRPSRVAFCTQTLRPQFARRSPSDLVLAPLVAAAQVQGPSAACTSRCAFVNSDGLLCRRGRRGDRLCVPASSALSAQVLHELHTTTLGGHYGRDKTIALACRSVWSPGLPAAVKGYVCTCPTCRRVEADHLPSASAAPDPAESGEAAAHLMGRVTAESRRFPRQRAVSLWLPNHTATSYSSIRPTQTTTSAT